MGHLFNFGYSNMWIFMILFGLLRLLIIIGVIYLIFRLINNNKVSTSKYDSSSRAIEILKERYAAGEISDDEYERKLKILKE